MQMSMHFLASIRRSSRLRKSIAFKLLCYKRVAKKCDALLLTSTDASVDSRIELAMTSQKSISNRLLLGAIFFGLNLLCFMGIAHGRHVERHTRVNYSHVPAHGTGRVGSRSGWVGHVITYDSLIDCASQIPLVHGVTAGPSATPLAALISVRTALPRPTMTTELLAHENVLALGSAPRAPGRGRAPPVA
jgi:hypothetical protein